MSSNSNAAMKQFIENKDQYSGNQPENSNLYNGLANLAEAIGDIEAKLDTVIQQLAILQQNRR
jgi:hypothetical protein